MVSLRLTVSQHGRNQFPDDSVPAMRATILAYIEQIVKIGTALSDMISISLGLSESFMREEYLSPEPISIVRCFKYVAPDKQPEGKSAWGIGEHTGAYYGVCDISPLSSSFVDRFRVLDPPEPRRPRTSDLLAIPGMDGRSIFTGSACM